MARKGPCQAVTLERWSQSEKPPSREVPEGLQGLIYLRGSGRKEVASWALLAPCRPSAGKQSGAGAALGALHLGPLLLQM